MALSKRAWQKFCEKFLKLCIIPENTICKYHILTTKRDGSDVVLQIDTEQDKYVLHLSICKYLKGEQLHSSDDVDDYVAIIIEDERIQIKVIRILIDGFKYYNVDEVINNTPSSCGVALKYVLRALAFNHAKSVKLHISKNTNIAWCYSLLNEEYKRVLSVLYELLDRRGDNEIDCALFQRGTEELYYTSEAVLKSRKKTVYVQSYVVQSKLFFKFSDSDVVNCKIINSVPYKHVPLVYDVLLCIFNFTTQKVRQHHFHEFLDIYYISLKENLRRLDLNVLDIMTYEKYRKLVKKFTPYAKLEVALSNCGDYIESLKVLHDSRFVSDIANLFDPNKCNVNPIWETILEIYDSVLYNNFSKEDCFKAIENKIESKDYEFRSWQITPVEENCGFLGVYYKLIIQIERNGKEETLNLFAKYAMTETKPDKDLARLTFEKEEFVYTTFILQANNVGLNEITDFLPKCYFSRPNDVLVLEDMSVMNYKSLSKAEMFSFENILLVTKQLAKLHACSLIFEEIMTEKLGVVYRLDDKFGKLVQEGTLVNDSGQPRPIITCGISAILNYLIDAFPDVPKELSLEEFKQKLKDLYGEMIFGEYKSPKFRNCLTQGDLWGNNLLFKRNENDKPTECCIIDYQLNRYCPPSHELLFFLYLNTDKYTRKLNMSKIILEYYNEVSQIFEKYNFDISNLYTYETFLESCDFMKPKAIALASLYLQLVLYPDEKFQELVSEGKYDHVTFVDRKELVNEVYCNRIYRDRMKDIIEDLYEVCKRR